jgi:hypothetical protein
MAGVSYLLKSLNVKYAFTRSSLTIYLTLKIFIIILGLCDLNISAESCKQF